VKFETYSYRFADHVLNSKLVLKDEILNTIKNLKPDLSFLSRPRFNQIINEQLKPLGWEPQPYVFDLPGDPSAKLDFMKERIGVEVEFGHSSFIGIDLLKFQVASYSGHDKIDVGIYIVTTNNFQKKMLKEYHQKWGGSLSYEKILRYLPYFKSAIQVPIYVIGIDI
jgi:hypothetical protein